MATATSYTVTDIIEMALRKLGVVSEGGTASTNQKSDAVEILNCIVKRFDADIYNRWFIKSAATTLAYTAGTNNNSTATDVLAIQSAVWETTATSTFVQLKELPLEDYAQIPAKTTSDTPEAYFLSTDLATPKLYIYPTPSANGSVYYWYRRKVDIFDNVTSDTADIPDQWLYWVVTQLAADLADDYGKPLEVRQFWQQRADQEFERIMKGEVVNPKVAKDERTL